MKVRTCIKVYLAGIECDELKIAREEDYFGAITWCSAGGEKAKDKNGWEIEPIREVDKLEAVDKYLNYRKKNKTSSLQFA